MSTILVSEYLTCSNAEPAIEPLLSIVGINNVLKFELLVLFVNTNLPITLVLLGQIRLIVKDHSSVVLLSLSLNNALGTDGPFFASLTKSIIFFKVGALCTLKSLMFFLHIG